MKLLMIIEINGGFSVKNKTLVANMQHVKWKEIPPLRGPNPQGLNVPGKKIIVVKNSEKNNVNNRQVSTKRRAGNKVT